MTQISKGFLKSVIALIIVLAHVLSFGQTMRVGLVLDKGGKDDKSFNSSAFAGAKKAEKDFKIQLKVVEASDDNAFEPLLRAFAQKKFDLIISIGFSQAEAVAKVAAQFPDQKIALVDSVVEAPKVKSLMFEEHEGSFLVGALAAMKSKNNTVGFIGGMDIPLIRRFQMGFEEGARKINPKIKIQLGYIGATSNAWNDPPKGKELALSQYKNGADVIFAAAGASNAGVFDAAEEKKLFAIGVDSNQNWVKPGFILTSMLKRVDLAVYNSIKDLSENIFTGGTTRFGLKSDGVGYALDEYNKSLISSEQMSRLENLRKEIIAGKLVVTDYYKKSKH